MTLQLPPFSYANLTLDETMTDLAVRFVLNCPPEDLSTPVRLMFQLEEANWFYVDYAKAQNPSLPLLRLKSFVAKIYQIVPEIKRIYADPDEALFQFSNYKRGIPVRGGIILNQKLDKVLLVRAWKAKTWGFPRGKINKGEDDLVCAVREVYEETGFDMSPYVKRQNYVEKTIEGKNFLLFFATGVPETTEFVTRTREEIEEIKWIPLSQIGSRASHKFFLVPIFCKDIERFAKRNRQSKFGSKHKNDRAARSAPASGGGDSSNKLKELLGIDSSASRATDLDKRSGHPPNVPAVNTPSLTTIPNGSPFVPNTYNGMMPLPVVYGAGLMPGSWGSGQPVPPNHSVLNHAAIPAASLPTNVPVGRSAETGDHGRKNILSLLNHQAEPEEHILPKESLGDPAHHIDILDQLMSSRRSRKSQHTSIKPTAKPRLKQNSLLQVLNSSRYTKQSKLLDLLKPSGAPIKPKNTGERAENALMKLLGHPTANPEAQNTKLNNTEPDTSKTETVALIDNPAVLKLLSAASLDADAPPSPTSPNPPSVPEPTETSPPAKAATKLPPVGNGGAGERQNLLDMLGIKSNTTKPVGALENMPANCNPLAGSENEISPVAVDINGNDQSSTRKDSQSSSAASPEIEITKRSVKQKGNSLLSLLGRQ